MSRTRKLALEPEGEITATFVNPGEWFKKRWLIGVGCGFSCLFYVVEADNESDAIDELTDSEWGHILKTDDDCPHYDRVVTEKDSWGDTRVVGGQVAECDCSFAGNYGERVDLDDIRVLRRLT